MNGADCCYSPVAVSECAASSSPLLPSHRLTLSPQYRQFNAFHKELRAAYPEQVALLPVFPRKRLRIRSMTPEVVTARQESLSKWLSAVVSEASLALSPLTRNFLSAHLDDSASFVAFIAETNSSVGVDEGSDEEVL